MAWLEIIILCVAIFFLQIGIPQLTPLLSFVPAHALSAPWTIVTSLFVHANVAHLFFNMWALFVFGPFLERRIGQKRFYALYLLAGIVGNIAFALLYPSDVAGLGASGAIFGVMGAMAMLMPNLAILVFFIPMPMWIAAIFWAVTEFLLAGSPDAVAHFTHLAGLGVGLLWGKYIKDGEPQYFA